MWNNDLRMPLKTRNSALKIYSLIRLQTDLDPFRQKRAQVRRLPVAAREKKESYQSLPIIHT